MNCEECKEQVVDLIEREAADPEGVRAILERCPDCRALFEDLRAALAAADRLPLEEPPSHLDAEILKAAALRRRGGGSGARRRFEAPPWAMAAIAMLAIGVGVWALPRDRVPDVPANDPAPAVERSVLGEVLEARPERPVGPSAKAPPSTAEPVAAALRSKARNEPKRLRKDKPSVGRRPSEGAAAPSSADAMQAVPRLHTAEEAESALNVEAASRSEAASLTKRDADDGKREAGGEAEPGEEACRRLISEQEQQADANEEAPRLAPERQLTLGRCYARLGRTEEARTWLERAASDPETRARAERALRELPGE